MSDWESQDVPDGVGSAATYRGRLLVATPLLESGPFYRTVVALLDHDAGGALGVVLNQPLDATVADVLPEWTGFVASPAAIFSGGPVATDSALGIGVLARPDESPTGWREMYGQVGLVDLDEPDPVLHAALRGVRVFVGYAGWSAGQLEGEVEDGSWIVVDAEDDDLLAPNPEALWRAVLRRQRSDLAMLSTFPDDPQLN